MCVGCIWTPKTFYKVELSLSTCLSRRLYGVANFQMNRGGRPHSPEEQPSRTVVDPVDMKNEESLQSHQQRNMLAEAIASLPPVPQNLSAIALFHQLPILYQQHYQHMLQSRILPYLQESLRLQNTVNFADKPQVMPSVSVSNMCRITTRRCALKYNRFTVNDNAYPIFFKTRAKSWDFTYPRRALGTHDENCIFSKIVKFKLKSLTFLSVLKNTWLNINSIYCIWSTIPELDILR